MMPRYYNCPYCHKKHEVNTECPYKNKYKYDKMDEEAKKIHKFYNSKAWKVKREYIRSRDKYCQRCWIKFGIVTVEDLEVHHIISLRKSWENRLNDDNLILICVNCHRFLDERNNGQLDFEWEAPEYQFEFR